MQSYSRKPLVILIISLLIFIIYKPEVIFAGSFNYVEAEGMGKAPNFSELETERASGFWAKILARRAAIVDLQRNLLIKAFNINKNNNKVSGVVKGVEVLSGEWDGKIYRVKGRALRENFKLN
ncbi:MAG: hypothetical protein II870_07875 [Synergistaceae bacterium]|nr:hypothetical protein [Synergistaceae bacterium]